MSGQDRPEHQTQFNDIQDKTCATQDRKGSCTDDKPHISDRGDNIARNSKSQRETSELFVNLAGSGEEIEKVKLKRLREAEHDLETAREYFDSDDFKQLSARGSLEGSVRNDEGQDIEEDDAMNMHKDSEEDSDVSYSSQDERTCKRKGSYDFVEGKYEENDDDDEYSHDDDGVSVELEDGDSDFDSENECTSISVTDSDEDVDQQELDQDSHQSDTLILEANPSYPNEDADLTSLTSEDCNMLDLSDENLSYKSKPSFPVRSTRRIDLLHRHHSENDMQDGARVESSSNDEASARPKRPVILFDPSQAPIARRRRLLSSPAELSGKPDHQNALLSNEANHAVNCKILKRYSEQLATRPDGITNLARSPSDRLHDRNYRQDCSCLMSPASISTPALQKISDNHEQDNSFTAQSSGTNFGPSALARSGDSNDVSHSKTLQPRPRIPRRTALRAAVTENNEGDDVQFVTPDDTIPLNGEPSAQVTGRHRGSPTVQPMDYTEADTGSTPDDITGSDKEESQDASNLPDILEDQNSETHPHGLIRKPAVRRKGYAWMSRSLSKTASHDGRRSSRQEGDSPEQGSSLDLAPSLLNIYDHRIATETRTNHSDDDDDNANDDDTDAPFVRSVIKSQSLPIGAIGGSVVSERRNLKLPSQKLPCDRPVSMMEDESSDFKSDAPSVDNKKRPLSISSMSSASSSSLPRLRKKRANAGDSLPIEGAREGSQISDCTVVPSGDTADSTSFASDSRHSVDSGCMDAERTGDSISLTSSETGSFRDEVDSSSTRDYTDMPASSCNKFYTHTTSPTLYKPSSVNSTHSLSELRRSKLPQSSHSSSTSLVSPKSSTPRSRSAMLSSEVDNDSGVGLEKSYHYNLPSSRHVAPGSYRKDQISRQSRNEARKRFFNNYEEHLKQSSNPIVARDETKVPEPLTASHTPTPSKRNGTYIDSSAMLTSLASVAQNTSGATVAGHRLEHSSQLSPSLEKTSRRGERKSSSSKHEGQATSSTSSSSSQRHGFSRSLKKRDPLEKSTDTSNRSSPVYVSYVQRVVTEIIESERTYIASLEDIIHGYLEPMEKTLNSNNEKKDIDCLFSNIKDIYKFGCTFLADLETTGADPVKVAECFVKHNKGFVIYTDYCTNYPRAVEVLTRFMQHPKLSEVCKQRQVALGHGLPLGAYLLRPVQRILKYHLLLQNIVKNCEKEGKEAAILEQAFHHMTHMAYHINEMKRKHEHAVRIQEIQSQLEDYVGEDLTRLGELVLEGTFRVYGAKASRQVFLFERGLLISKKKEGGMLSCKTFIRCSNLMLVEVIPNEPLSFHVIPFDSPRAQYTLQARNMEQKRRWCQEIKQLILESFKGRIPDSVKNLVMQLGREHDDDYIPKEALEATRKNQHTAPEYLEKRRFRRKSGSRLPDFSILKPQRVRRGSKKGESKSGEKLSPERGRRAESKSPEAHRSLFSKQNNSAKRRTQSTNNGLPSAPITDTSTPQLFIARSRAESSHIIGQPKKPDQKSKTPSSPVPTSPVTLRRMLKERLSESDDDMRGATGIKRPASFLMARARPILSEDLTPYGLNSGGSVKLSSPPEGVECVEEEEDDIKEIFSSPSDPQNSNDFSHRSRSDVDDSLDGDANDIVAEIHTESVSLTEDMNTDQIDGENDHSFNAGPAPLQKEVSHYKTCMRQTLDESLRTDPRCTSMPVLCSTGKNQDGTGKREESINRVAETKTCSQSSDSVYESASIPKPRGRMSRRDMQNVAFANGQNIRRKGIDMTEQDSRSDRKVTAFHDSFTKRAAEKAVLEKRGLRLPNTCKHLLMQDNPNTSQSSETKAKLTNWNSVDKLTKGSLIDLSHLDEEPWVRNLEATSSKASMDDEFINHPNSRLTFSGDEMVSSTGPHGHSAVTEMAQVSNNKENLDWLVYLNRNSIVTSSHQSLGPSKILSTPAVNKHSQGKDSSVSGYVANGSSEIPYATPSNPYMGTEKHGSVNNSPTQSPCQDHSTWNSSNSFSPSVNAFGVPSMTITVARSVNLSRCNSSPITSKDSVYALAKKVSKERPVSMDMDKLTDESDRMMAEMEEYINKTSSSESIKTPSKFPTTLPAITVEDEDVKLNRLSVVSSISTSSYDSQCSSSSDGLVGTLKHKLHTWALYRNRNDSEYSQPSMLTSDEEGKEESPSPSPPNLDNTFEPHSKQRSSLKEDRQLETVLREHSLGSSKLGSRMAHSMNIPSELITSYLCSDSSSHEFHPHNMCGLTTGEHASQPTETACLVKDSPTDQARFSLPPTTEATEALMPPALKACEIQQSDSGFSLQSNDSNMSDQPPGSNEIVPPVPVLELSEESSKEVSPKVKPKIDKGKPPSDFNKHSSCESIDSTDSFYERKLSVVFDSMSQDQPAIVNVYEDLSLVEVEVEVPLRKSIREVVHDFEEKCRSQSPKVIEVKRREPGVMIRQRMETLRESVMHGWQSHSSSRPASEERDHIRPKSLPPSQTFNQLEFAIKFDHQCNDDIKVNCMKPSHSRDSLSRSVENLSKFRDNVFLSTSRENLCQSKSRENLYLSKSRENLYQSKSHENVFLSKSKSKESLNSDKAHSSISSPSYNTKSSNPGHEKDANRFSYKTPERPVSLLGNQFVHRARSNSEQPIHDPERSLTVLGSDCDSKQTSKSMCQLDQMSNEVENLVIMKGWVRALIAKFQDIS